MTHTTAKNRMKRYTILWLCIVFVLAFLLPMAAYAQPSGKTVRVGWFDSPFNTMDQFGRRSADGCFRI